jgi:hypothetical protein
MVRHCFRTVVGNLYPRPTNRATEPILTLLGASSALSDRNIWCFAIDTTTICDIVDMCLPINTKR